MLRVGLTGGIGSGKSAVARRLAAHGAVIVDADAIAREVVASGTPGLAQVVEAFGSGVLAPDGGLDRAALGAVVFTDPAARRRLEGITHPLIGARTAELTAAAEAAGAPVLVHDVPLLVELGMASFYDVVVVVEAPEELRLSRLGARGVPREDAVRRMAAQASPADRRAVATHVVDNGGTEPELDDRVTLLWQALTLGQGGAAIPPPASEGEVR